MDLLDVAQLKAQFLAEMAGVADDRIRALVQEALLHRGGGQHLGALAALIEGHRDRVGQRLSDAKARQAAEGATAEAIAEGVAQQAECAATISGIHDALAYLRAQARAAELSASQADAALQEAQRHREDLATRGRAQDGKIAQFMAQLDTGTPREELGRPESAEAVRADLQERRAEVQAAAAPKPPRRRRAAAS